MQSNAQPASANDDNYVAMPYADDHVGPTRRSEVSPMSNSWDKRWVSGSGEQAKSYTVYFSLNVGVGLHEIYEAQPIVEARDW